MKERKTARKEFDAKTYALHQDVPATYKENKKQKPISRILRVHSSHRKRKPGKQR